MEKFMQKKKDIVEYDSPLNTRRSSEDMDFDDVFGGPPRRFSMPEIRVRYSFGYDQSEEEGESSSGKPVFGGESAAARRRRQGGDDFYGDIFRGDEYSSPRRSGNLIGSNSPGSRIMSPVSFRPKADPFGTSLPSHFSLPAKLTNAMEFPRNQSRNKMDESTSGLNSPGSSSSLSRFSNLGIQGHDVIGNEVYSVHHQSPLPPEASFTSDENIKNLKNDTRNLDGFGNQFHFSIYSWAGDGGPMLMPLGVGNNLKSKDISVNEKSDHIETEKRDLWKKEEPKKLENSFEEALYDTPESKSRSGSKESVGFGRTRQNIKDEQVKSVDKIDNNKKPEKAPLKVEESRDSEMKPFHAFLSDEDEEEQPENVKEMNENKTRSSKKANTKRNGGTAVNLNNDTVDKSSLPGEAINSGTGSGKNRVTRKVSDFVHIFNQEYDSRTKADIKTRSQSFRWKDICVNQEKNEASLNAAKVNLKKDLSSRSFHFSANQQDAFSSESTYKDSKISVENSDDPLEDNFLVQEIFDDQEEVKQGEASEVIKALDTKIQQWSVGKKGNIRSLLSTLQYVLWDGSGWKPVALVDLIEENSVKRAYQKALLRLHPDKLQQKDASVHHKYIAQKVFDILQEAWDGFNNLAPL